MNYQRRKADVGVEISANPGNATEINFITNLEENIPGPGWKLKLEVSTGMVAIGAEKIAEDAIIAEISEQEFGIEPVTEKRLRAVLLADDINKAEISWGGSGSMTLKVHFPDLVTAARSKNEPGGMRTRRN